MVIKKNKKNFVFLKGIVTDFRFSHEENGEKIYKADIDVRHVDTIKNEDGTKTYQFSDKSSIFTVLVPENKINPEMDYIGKLISMKGKIRTIDNRMTFFANEAFKEISEKKAQTNNSNGFILQGYICKKEVIPKRDKTEVVIEVNDEGKISYIPCVAKNKNSRALTFMQEGDKVYMEGFIKRRTYRKRMKDGTFVERSTFDIFITSISK